ncbi:MAG: ABC transporter substrate-binding protein [Candidatus Moranbacteria bacterium]|nr:ABC transporter substrate-binding protein [Candidatus Moranbacteria bacterium]
MTSLFFWIGSWYFRLTQEVPKQGGEYIEGVVGQPMYVNPLLSQTSEADSDLVQLIYSGLLKYDNQGNLVNNLAESYEISSDQKTHTVHLRKNIKWHDGEQLDASDVFFTLSVVQDPAYKSPLRQNWQGVEVSQVDDYTLSFALNSPYFGFPRNLTMGILPKHIWENIAPEKFSLAEYNLRPIGSGPYQFSDLQKDSSGNILTYNLAAFKDYFEGQPNISKITFNFYPDEDAAVSAYNEKEIKGIGNIAPEKISEIKVSKSTRIHELNIPRYFAVFFNQTKNIALANDDVRKALAYGTNRQEIIENVLHGKGTAVHSPFLLQMKECEQEINKYDFDIQKAEKILEESGWKYDEGEKVRKKGDVKLEFSIFTTDWPELSQTADILRGQWEKIGAKVKVEVLAVSDLQQNYIRPREYDALLFGQAVSFSPDPYSFWHSSQKKDPGLNLSLLDDKKADELLEKARQELDENKRVEYYHEFQKVVAEEIPAVFLYSPSYLYPVSQKVKGIRMENVNSPSGRFSEADKWYIKTKRVRK